MASSQKSQKSQNKLKSTIRKNICSDNRVMTEFFTNQVLIGAGLVVGSVPVAMLLRAAGDYLVMPLTNRFIRAMSTPNPNPTPSDFWGPGGFFDSVGRAGRVVLISNLLS
ncbi:MAG: hypothetical protein Q8P67_18575, partial [archaeon]|nr:hypothetical protein [archaeon]